MRRIVALAVAVTAVTAAAHAQSPADSLAAPPVALDSTTDAASSETPPETAPAAPVRHVFGRSGLVLTLPPGWMAPVADESRLPAYARYTVAVASGPLAGVSLVVERLVGLTPLDRERWRFGQSRAGYHGVQPVGPAAVPVPGATGIETAGAGRAGATAFVQRGDVFWAVAVVAPPATWRDRRGDVLEALAYAAFP